MPSEKAKELIEKGRAMLRSYEGDLDEPSDQEMKLPQPPLVKEKMSSEQINLPNNFSDLPIENDFLKIINRRESRRVYTEEPMSLLQLSYLLWTTQGIKSVRGKNYATLRTVPGGGARHEFETYLIVKKIENLKSGTYHYLPMTHQIEFLQEIPNQDLKLGEALYDQKWASSANVVFFWSVVPYRFEWRYSYFRPGIIMVDAGYISENLYLACESLGLGTCAIGAFDRKICDELFGLDGKEEFTVLANPVGTVSVADKSKEQAFYAFLKQQE